MIRVRSLAVALSAMLLMSTVAACGSGGDDAPKNVSAKTAALGTLTPGVIKVAVQPYAPYTSVQGGRVVGLDGDILAYVARKLGLKVEPEVTDFAGDARRGAVPPGRHHRGRCRLVRGTPEAGAVHRSALLLAAA